MGRRYAKPDAATHKTAACPKAYDSAQIAQTAKTKPQFNKGLRGKRTPGRQHIVQRDELSPEEAWNVYQMGGRVAVRVTVPLINADQVTMAAAVFRELAEQLSQVSASDAKMLHKVFEARWAIMRAQRKLKGGASHFKGAR